MSNVIVGGWSALEAEIHHIVEFASNCAGPDGAAARVKHGVSKVLAKFRALAIEEAASAATDLAKPVIAASLGPVAAVVAETVLDAVVAKFEAPAAESSTSEAE
jgi:hypothetical protein